MQYIFTIAVSESAVFCIIIVNFLTFMCILYYIHFIYLIISVTFRSKDNQQVLAALLKEVKALNPEFSSEHIRSMKKIKS